MARVRSNKSGGNGGINDSGNNNPSQKRHQRRRGYPDTDAKIIEMTPEELTDDRLFACMVCNEVFLREQNLILHVRSHSIRSELKKNSEDRSCKNAFVCPIITCRHHDPKRALSDITGIKKHYGRAHGDKKWVCTLCNKAYGVEADLKAHSKLHFKESGAVTSKRALPSNDRPEAQDELAITSDNSEEEKAAGAVAASAAAAVSKDNGHTDYDDISLSLGVGGQQEVYMPQFDLAPVLEDREQGQAATNERATLDFDLELLGSLPIGLTSLLTGCIPHPEVPVSAENSVPPNALFGLASAPPAPPNAGDPGALNIPIELALPTVHQNLSISSFGAHYSGAGMLQSLSSPAVEGQYRTTQEPASWQKELQAAQMMGPNASVMTPPLLSNPDGFQMPHPVTIPFTDKYYFTAGAASEQAVMNAPIPSLSSFVPLLGGSVLVNTNYHAMGAGFSNGLFAGYADPNRERELVNDGAGNFFLGTPSVTAPQQQPIDAVHDFSYQFMPGINDADAAAAASNTSQLGLGLQTGYAVPPSPAVGLANQRSYGSGDGAMLDLDLNF